MHSKKIMTGGVALQDAGKVLIMVHGRGGSATDIMSLSQYLNIPDYAILAPEATGNTWYPLSFLAPATANEPWLSSALKMLDETMNEAITAGVPPSNIFLLGFSQGACLALEFATRRAQRFGGIVAFTGGLIGESINIENYSGNFDNTPVFIGTSNPDAHVPVERVQMSAKIMTKMGANVTVKVYEMMGHTINNDEISEANNLIFK